MSNSETQQSVAFYTLGCKTNQLESSTIAQEFRQNGWQVVPFDEAASVYVVNTCTVTERGDQESRRIIRRARLSNPQGRVVVTGCYAQVAPEELAALEGVHYVVGNNFKDEILNIIEETPLPGKPLVKVSEIDKSRIMVGASEGGIDRTRGSLKIQDGCDYKCTYCIIWEARGLSRSLPIEDVKRHLQFMIFEGFKEIVLTGINIGQYDDEGRDLADLLSALMDLPGAFRLRLTSLDPLEVPRKLVDVVAEGVQCGKICPHFHLSAQSAEDTVLKRMARRHHVADMLDVCDYIHEKIPQANVGSDIIVGFPGETPEKFETTFANLERCQMEYFHVFSYSKRKGTPAATFEDQIPEREKKQRAQRLRDLSERKSRAYREQFIGQTVEVIVEESCQKGMSENYLHVTLDANGFDLQPNDRAVVRIEKITDNDIFGTVESVVESHSALYASL